MPRQRNENRIVKESSCWGRRTILEKILLALVLLAAIAILALAISVYVLNLHSEHNYQVLARAEALRAARSESPGEAVHTVLAVSPQQQQIESKEPSPCSTPGCVRAAVKVMDTLDETVDPCNNFYEFACGNYLKKTEIPKDKGTVDSFSVVRDLLQEQLRTIINEPPLSTESKPFKLAKNYNQACLNLSIIADPGEKPLADILEAYGGWPVVKGDLWSGDSWDWVEVLKKFRLYRLETSIVFSFAVTTDLKNSTKRVLDIDQTSLGLAREFLIKGFDEKLVQSYHNFMIDNAVIFGAKREVAEQELKESIEFEIKLANISLPNEERRNVFKPKMQMAILPLFWYNYGPVYFATPYVYWCRRAITAYRSIVFIDSITSS